MGMCMSSMAPQGLIPDADGDEDDYNQRYLEVKKPTTTTGGGTTTNNNASTTSILGEGEFGQVRLVHDTVSNRDAACKILKKGAVFRDNVLYAPLKPHVLLGEVNMLRALSSTKSGKKGGGGDDDDDNYYCLQLYAVYESRSTIYIVTECCHGGDLNQWTSQLTDGDLHVYDASRIARELFTAVAHCDQFHILHRDIKPANVMFLHNGRDSPLRLIDFGSGRRDDERTDGGQRQVHTTMAGSGFFIAPEVFQRNYNGLADVWSAAVTLYVLVAGYPSECLQQAFNLLQKSQRDLRQLPGHEDLSLPQSYIDFLSSALTYHAVDRPSAQELLTHEFLRKPLPPTKKPQLPPALSAQPQQQPPAPLVPVPPSSSLVPSANIIIEGSVRRHSLFLDFAKFERSLTALLAAMLAKDELAMLVTIAAGKQGEEKGCEDGGGNQIEEPHHATASATTTTATTTTVHHLNVIPVADVKAAVGKIHPIVLETINAKLPSHFDSFSYHTALLNEFLDYDRQTRKNELVNDERASQRSNRSNRRPNLSNRSLRGSFRNVRAARLPRHHQQHNNNGSKRGGASSIHFGDLFNKQQQRMGGKGSSTGPGIVAAAVVVAASGPPPPLTPRVEYEV